MTGFARAAGSHDGLTWTWEVKSVNGRGLDVRSRLANGFEAIEIDVRKAVSKRFQRGNFSVNFQVARAVGDTPVQINWAILEQLRDVVSRLEHDFGAVSPSVDGLLGLRGVMELGEAELDDEARAARDAAALETFATALDDLLAMRQGEGRHLTDLLEEQMTRIETLVGDAERNAATQPEAIRERLQRQLDAVLADGTGLPEERIAQEVALLATKADVREELDRLRGHIAAVRELLAAGGVIGRRLDFLAQEFNREANTLCSKSQDAALTNIGLELKTVIDQLREQAQNIE